MDSYNSEMAEILENYKTTEIRTLIFNGEEYSKSGVSIDPAVTLKDEHKDKLGAKLKIIIEKRYTISSHIEKAMVLFDIAKKKKIMAETKTDVSIAECIYKVIRGIIKEMAENFQFVDREMKNMVDEIGDCNMPFKPNPF